MIFTPKSQPPAQKIADQRGHFGARTLQQEVATVEQVDLRVDGVLGERAGTVRPEDLVVLAPDRQHRDTAAHRARIPKRFANVHPRYMTPAFGTIVMGVSALSFYLLLTALSENALADSVASLGLAVAFYYGDTAYACVWYFRRTLFASARNLMFRGIFPLIGALAMTWAFFQSAKDMIQPDYGYTAFGPVGGVFVLGLGMLVLGIPLMLACFAFGTKRFFRGETLNAQTEVKVPDVY